MKVLYNRKAILLRVTQFYKTKITVIFSNEFYFFYFTNKWLDFDENGRNSLSLQSWKYYSRSIDFPINRQHITTFYSIKLFIIDIVASKSLSENIIPCRKSSNYMKHLNWILLLPYTTHIIMSLFITQAYNTQNLKHSLRYFRWDAYNPEGISLFHIRIWICVYSTWRTRYHEESFPPELCCLENNIFDYSKFWGNLLLYRICTYVTYIIYTKQKCLYQSHNIILCVSICEKSMNVLSIFNLFLSKTSIEPNYF